EARAAGQGGDAAAGKQPAGPGGKTAEEKAPAPPKPAVTYPRVERFEKMGLKLEQFLEQVQGPVQVGLFLQQVEDEVPESLPVSLLAAMLLKDAAPVAQALDAASAGAQPRYTKEPLGGGIHYVETAGDKEAKPGFWLKDKYLAYTTDREILEYAVAALAHQGGNERMSDRNAYKQARNLLDPQALLTIYGEAEQVLEMPYRLSKVNWEEDAQVNPWPTYALIRPLLQNRPVLVQFSSIPEGLQGYARTPLTLYGMIEAFRRPFAEAGLW
ncbi:MAG: hypothetical protein NTW87_20130, partial [Planctomycetota bacterium]|nr:hypothetical protein [Planctomycetota bacterium]